MKMSDVFNLPVLVDEYGFRDQGQDIGCIYTETKEEYVIHAINMHDELVEALETLIDDIDHKHCIRLENTIGVSTRRVLNNAIDILNKAKGLDK